MGSGFIVASLKLRYYTLGLLILYVPLHSSSSGLGRDLGVPLMGTPRGSLPLVPEVRRGPIEDELEEH